MKPISMMLLLALKLHAAEGEKVDSLAGRQDTHSVGDSGKDLEVEHHHHDKLDQVCDKPWTLTLESGIHSQYWSRGLTANDDPVEQLGLTFTHELGDKAAYGNLGLQYWHNLDLTSFGGQAGEITENDYAVFWGLDLPGDLNLELGHIYYDYPEAATDNYTAEVYAKLSFEKLLKPYIELSPFIQGFYDYQNGNGWYLTAGASYEIALDKIGKDWALDLSSGIGWADGNFNQQWSNEPKSRSSWTDYWFQVGLNVPLYANDSVSAKLHPYVKWCDAMDRLRNNGGESGNVMGGMALILEF